MKAFDLSTCPLAGVNLIEASAGTGKTHALAGLYLRFLVEKKLGARQLLVITYTNAATAELKRRIRQMIAGAQTAFLTTKASSSFLKDLLDKYPDAPERKRIARDLGIALANFDETAIYTIHGFCQRILMDNAFASGTLFETEFIENQQKLEQEFVEDFWRRHFYENHPVIVQYALNSKMDTNTLLALLRMVLSKPDLKVIPEYEPFSMDAFERDLKEVRESFSHFKLLWRKDKDAIVASLRNKALSGLVYGKKVDGLIREVGEMMDVDDVSLPPPGCLQKLSADYLSKKTNKDQKTPRHAIFDLSQEMLEQSARLEESLKRYLSGLKKEFMERACVDFPALKRKKNVLYFDDLLSRAYEALRASGGDRLAEILSNQYQAALVDEFQDTDPIQFAILQSVFLTHEKQTDHALFYIGDPKQAIYSFRGADIYAYLRAAKSVDHQYTMQHNWRSEASLINAVNVLFQKPEQAFVYSEIPYSPIRQAPEAKIKPLTIAGEEATGLHWWFLPGHEDGKPLGVGFARSSITRLVVAEISRLLKLGHDQKAFIGEKPVKESDIAILVRKNTEAITFKKVLASAGIPSVIYSSESVFSSDEAQELRRLMLGVIHYENEGYLLSALTTAFFDKRAEEIAACAGEDDQLEGWRIKFQYYNDLWQTNGLLTMFTILLEQDDARLRIASYSDGERRLTNYSHLAQLLFQAQTQGNLRPSDLLGWFDNMMLSDDNAMDDQQLRLETDRNCVRIVTIHKSKGLEYPVCFCPFAWETGPNQKENLPLCFHDENNNWQATADLGSENTDAHKELYNREVLAENCRLLYVALTRAKNRCYFVWGNIKGTQSSAVSYLFHRQSWVDKKLTLSNGDMIDQITSFSSHNPQDIKITSLEEISAIESWLPEKEMGKIHYQEFPGRIDHRWKIASYTYLTHSAQDDSEWDEEINITSYSEAVPETKTADNILFFPPGATSGILLHEILEKLDFTHVREEQTKTIVREALEKFNYPLQWQPGILKMLEEVVQARLGYSGGGEFSLSQIDNAHCRKELEFYFPLQTIIPAKLMSVLELTEQRQNTTDQKKLNFPPVQGVLKGFIDLVFEYNGQYYLADWKSNDLGDRCECYTPALLKQEMIKSFYDVQYLIYTVALDQYLKKRLPGYAYEKHFGGVYYFFLRGLNAKTGTANGIFYDRPAEELIVQLKKVLLVHQIRA
jgi:exodeoxyribonuclease V beta subunit